MKIRHRTGPRTLPWGHSSLDRKRKWKYPVECRTLATRVEEVTKPCVELALDAKGRGFGKYGKMPDAVPFYQHTGTHFADLYQKHEICPERQLWSHVWRWGPSIVRWVEAECPRWSDLFWNQIGDLRWSCWRKGRILYQLWWSILLMIGSKLISLLLMGSVFAPF